MMTAALVGSVCAPAEAAAPTANARPAVSSLSVTAGKTTGGTRVTVHGSGFVHVTAVRFGGTAGHAVKTLSSRTVTVTSPAHAAGLVDVIVVTRSGPSRGRTTDRFRFVGPPRVTSVTPSSGTSGAATRVTVHGSDLLKATRVTFGGIAGTRLTVSSTAILVTAPTHAAQTVDVQVTTPFGTSARTPADRFTFRDAPVGVSGLAISAATPTTTSLSWHASATGANGDIVIRRAGGTVAPTSSSGVALATLPPTATTYDDQSTSPGTTYSFAVFGHNADGYSAPATVTVTTPSGPYWHAPQPVDRSNYSATRWSSCPTATFCMTVDGVGNYQFFDGTSWSRPVQIDDSPGGFTALACASPSSCMAIDWSRRWTQWNGTNWTTPATVDSVKNGTVQDAVSCSSASFCARTSNNGTAAVFDGRAWSPATALPLSSSLNRGEPLTMTCLSGTFCMEMDTAGNTATYDGRAWHGISSTDSFGDFNVPRALSCATPSFCMAIQANRTWIFDGSAWHSGPGIDTVGDVFDGSGVACVAATTCVAVAADGAVQIYDGTSWTLQPSAAGTTAPVSCPTATTCFMGGAGGNPPAVTYDPTAREVTRLPQFPSQGGYGAVSCSSSTFCHMVDGAGNSLTYDGTAWSVPRVFPLGRGKTGIGLNLLGNPGIVSCTGSTFCMAGGYLQAQDGTYQNHAAITRYDGSAWLPLTDVGADRNHQSISAVSCVSPTSCYATNVDNGITRWDGTAWSPMQDIATSARFKGFQDISCVGDGFCVAIDPYSAYTHRGGSTWSEPSAPNIEGSLRAISCASSTFCVAVTDTGSAVNFDGKTWSPAVSVAPNHRFVDVWCTSSTFCVAIDSGTDAYTYDGTSWTSRTIDPAGGGLTSISCTSESFCVAIDLDGNALRYS